ncbi:MAG: prefoldin subunit alpha [Nanoarchaeota archaeon]|nr:prefoldin subunit alpha [Nanoarchaeota archaeon]
MEEQELMLKLGMYEQQIRQLQQQFQAVDEGITELTSIDFGLDEIKGSTGKEILVQIGRGIFVKAEIRSEDLIVNIGNKNLVKKDVPETKRILREQIVKLESVKKELAEKMDEIQEEAKNMILAAQKE